MARSPAAASLHGLEPDLVYSAMFLSRASRYFHPSASPMRWRIGRHGEIARARGGRVGHHHLPLVDGLGQVGPGRRHGQVVLLRHLGVDAEGRHVDVDADPRRRVGLVAEERLDLVEPLGRVGLEQPRVLEDQDIGGAHAPDGLGLHVVLLGHEPGRDVAGGQAQHLDARGWAGSCSAPSCSRRSARSRSPCRRRRSASGRERAPRRAPPRRAPGHAVRSIRVSMGASRVRNEVIGP